MIVAKLREVQTKDWPQPFVDRTIDDLMELEKCVHGNDEGVGRLNRKVVSLETVAAASECLRNNGCLEMAASRDGGAAHSGHSTHNWHVTLAKQCLDRRRNISRASLDAAGSLQGFSPARPPAGPPPPTQPLPPYRPPPPRAENLCPKALLPLRQPGRC